MQKLILRPAWIRSVVTAAMCLMVASRCAEGAAVDGIQVESPVVDGDRELIEPDAVLIVDVAPYLSQVNVITDGAPVSKAALIGLDSAGQPIPGVFLDISLAVITQNYADGGSGVDNLVLNLPNVNPVHIEELLQTIGVSSFQLVVTTFDITLDFDHINGVRTKWSVDENLDQCFEYEFPPPLIRMQSSSVVVDAGASSLVLQIEATGAPPLSYEWRRNGVSLVGNPSYLGANTPVLTMSSPQASNTDIYTVTVSSPYGSDTSEEIIVAVRSNTCDGDSNGDGVVNFSDISEVIARWLNACP